MLTRDSTRHFECLFITRVRLTVFGVEQADLTQSWQAARNEKQDCALSFLSPSLLNHLSPQTPVHNTPNSSVWRSPSKVQFQFQLHSPHITLTDASDDRKARWERKKTLLLRPSPISSCCSYSMSFHFVSSCYLHTRGTKKKKKKKKTQNPTSSNEDKDKPKSALPPRQKPVNWSSMSKTKQRHWRKHHGE